MWAVLPLRAMLEQATKMALCLLSCLQFSDFCFLFFADIIDFISFTILEKLALFQHLKSESLSQHYDNQICSQLAS